MRSTSNSRRRTSRGRRPRVLEENFCLCASRVYLGQPGCCPHARRCVHAKQAQGTSLFCGPGLARCMQGFGLLRRRAAARRSVPLRKTGLWLTPATKAPPPMNTPTYRRKSGARQRRGAPVRPFRHVRQVRHDLRRKCERTNPALFRRPGRTAPSGRPSQLTPGRAEDSTSCSAASLEGLWWLISRSPLLAAAARTHQARCYAAMAGLQARELCARLLSTTRRRNGASPAWIQE